MHKEVHCTELKNGKAPKQTKQLSVLSSWGGGERLSKLWNIYSVGYHAVINSVGLAHPQEYKWTVEAHR